MTSEYATLEEAFGVSSFLAPEPQVLRGDVGKVQGARQKTMDRQIAAAGGPQGERPAPAGLRLPQQLERDQIVERTQPCRGRDLARAHATGGAEAAWKMVPESARADMMWYAVKHAIDSDFLLMVLVGLAMVLLLK